MAILHLTFSLDSNRQWLRCRVLALMHLIQWLGQSARLSYALLTAST